MVNNMNSRSANSANSRGCGCRRNSTRAVLLRHVQMHGVAMVEAGLYLDAHPDCRRALEYFRRQRELYMKYAAEYEAAYGPLTMAAQADGDCWKWVQGPWPWESEAN